MSDTPPLLDPFGIKIKIDAEADGDLDGARVSRREFLGAMSTTGMLGVPNLVGAQSQEGQPENDQLVIRSPSEGSPDLEVLFKGMRWLIEARAFGPAAKLVVLNKFDGRRISVSSATWRKGKTYSALFDFTRLEQGWSLGLRMQGWPASGYSSFTPVSLDEWMSGQAKLSSVSPIGSGQWLMTFSRSVLFEVPKPVSLSFLHDLSWAVEATDHRPIRTMVGPAFHTGRVRFGRQLATAELEGIWAEADGLVDDASPEWILARSKAEKLSLISFTQAKLTFAWPDNPRQPAWLRIVGSCELVIDTSRGREGPFKGGEATLHITGGGIEPQTTTLSMTASQEPWRMRGALVTLMVQGGTKNVDRLDVEIVRGMIRRFDGSLHVCHADIHVSGSSLSDLCFEGEGCPVHLHLATGPSSTPPRLGYGELILGELPSLSLPLEEARLRVCRAWDLLSLRYRFWGLSLLLQDRSGPLVVRSNGKPADDGPDGAVIAIELPPQHVAEQTYRLEGEKMVSFNEVSGARLSGTSRIAFKVPDSASPGETILPFSLDGLLSALQMVTSVTRRAQTVDAATLTSHPAWSELGSKMSDFAALLRYQDVSDGQPQTNAQRMDRILAGLKAPTDFETAIELPFRLQLSPSQTARWRATEPDLSAEGLRRQGVPLWQLTLEEPPGRNSVRAVWSPDFLPDAIIGRHAAPSREDDPWFLTPMNAFARHEIVGLSSVHGLPVMPREGADGKLDGSQLTPPDGFQILYAPKKLDRDKQAIYLAKALDVKELALSSLGGNLDLETGFQPFSLKGGTRPSASSVQLYRQRTILGRDIEVRIEEKGFLFPIGLRCTLVILTQRRFGPNPAGGYPTAYLMQREFIEVDNAVKTYPALGQLNNGRAWPAHKLKLLTSRTPDINSPTKKKVRPSTGQTGSAPLIDSETGRVWLNGTDTNDVVFWPRTGQGRNVLFEFVLDDSAGSIMMPLIFVSNKVAHVPAALRQLVDYYNKITVDPASSERVVDHGGARRRYAPETVSGQNTHSTQKWWVSVEGRLAASPNGEQADVEKVFEWDPVLEGADQPPFYPVMEQAEITLSQIERISGSAIASTRAVFDRDYLSSGFDPGTNKAGLYLRLLNNVPLRFSGQADANSRPFAANGHRAGGVAQPHVSVNALSRDHGPMGGMGLPSTNSEVAASSPSFSLADCFDTDARILGFLDLKSILQATKGFDAVPKLLESVEYTVDGAADQVHELICKEILPSITGAVRSIVNDLAKANSDEPDKAADADESAPDTSALVKLYPDVGLAARSCMDIVDQVKATCQRQEDKDAADLIFKQLGGLYEAGRRLIGALERASRDPLAPVREQMRKDFVEQQSKLAATVTDAVKSHVQALTPGWGHTLIRQLLTDAAMQNWRRLALAYPLPPMGINLEDISAQLDQDMVQRLLEQEWQAADGFKTFFDQVVDHQRKALLDYIDERLHQAPQPTLDDLKRYKALVAGPWEGGLATNTFSAVERLANALTAHEDAFRERVVSTAQLADLVATIRQIRKSFERVHVEIASLLQAALPEGLDGLASELCEAGALALGRASLAALPDEPVSDLKALLDAMQTAQLTLGTLGRDILHDTRLPDGANVGLSDRIATMTSGIARLRTTIAAHASALVALRSQLVKQSDKDLAKALCVPAARIPIELIARLDKTRTQLQDSMQLLLRNAIQDQKNLVKVMDALLHDQPALGKVVAPYRASLAMASASLAQTGALTARNFTLLGALTSEKPSLLAKLGVTKPNRRAHLDDMLSDLDSMGTQLKQGVLADRIKTTLHQMRNTQGGMEAVNADLGKVLEELSKAIQSKQIDQVISQIDQLPHAWSDRLGGWISATERPVLDILATTLMAEKTLASALASHAWNIIQPVMALLLTVDKSAYEACKFLDQWLIGGDEPNLFSKLFNKFKDLIGSRLKTDKDLLYGEIDALKEIESPVTDPQQQVRLLRKTEALIKAWGEESPLIRLIADIKELANVILSGDLAKLVDLDAPRRQLEQTLRSFLPKRISTSYGFDVPVSNFSPSGDEFFVMPKTPSGPGKLVLGSKMVVDLEGKTSKMSMYGRLDPFSLRLLGPFHVVTLNFSQTSFKSENGAPPSFDMKLQSVELGPQVNFLKSLEAFMGPKPGSGFYLTKLPGFSGISTGYELDLGTITLGNLAFINVRLGAGCVLRFDEGKPVFTVSLSRREAPFLISAAPYGGGGFLSLQSDGRQITGFEASFEYGGVGAFSYGPLDGSGRITTGIYVRSVGGTQTVEGIFFCGGSSRVGWFSTSASLSVRMAQYANGLVGEAAYTFSFSVGFSDIDFSVTVWKQESNQTEQHAEAPAVTYGSEAQALALAHTTPRGTGALMNALFTPETPLPMLVRASTGVTTAAPAKPPKGAMLINKAIAASQDWEAYNAYFDDTLDQDT